MPQMGREILLISPITAHPTASSFPGAWSKQIVWIYVFSKTSKRMMIFSVRFTPCSMHTLLVIPEISASGKERDSASTIS